ncbi:hypothetical protein INR49_005182 [Caranx melampygus]|nr:hypothetical protein INR49_005182 [Caranx melampygus]
MAGLVSSVGLVLMLKALMHGHGRRAVFLGVTVLWVTLIAADSPAADESLLDSAYHPMGFLGDAPSSTGSSPSSLPASHYTAFESPDTPGALPTIMEPKHEARTADIMPFQWGHAPSGNPQSFTPSEAVAEQPHPLSIPSLSPSEPALGSTQQQFEAPAKLSTDWKLARINSAKQSSSLPVTPTRTPQLGLNAEHKALDSPLAAFSERQGAVSEQTPSIMTSQPVQPLELPNLAFADSPADESYGEILDVNQLSPSSAPLHENKPAHSIDMLPNNKILAPGYNVPLIVPHHTSPSSEPTEVSPEDFYPTNTMDVDWGSGDYLETMSFLNSDGDDFSLVTKVPSDSYDPEDYTESYDTSFPSRVGISPLSLHPSQLSPTPSLMTAYSTIVPLKSIHPSTFSSTIHYTMEPTPTADSDIPDPSDTDWGDAFSIQPTDVLLPDMNSLEYYTIQLTKENNSSDTGAEQRGNITVVSLSTTVTTPTGSITNGTELTEEESLSDLSGSEPQDDLTTVVTTKETPQLANVTEPFLDPSIVPSHVFDPSSSIWEVLGDQGVTENGVDNLATMSLIPTSSEAITVSAVPSTTPATTTTHQATTRVTATTEASTSINIITTTSEKTPTAAPTARPYFCNIDRPTYLVKMGFPSGATVGYAKTQIKDILKVEFNKSVELQVVDPPPNFVFRVVSGPVVYTAISVVNTLRRSGRRFLSVSPNWTTPNNKYQVHTVLQFVPSHIDVRVCNFSESIEKGLTKAFAEVRRRSKESTNFTVHPVDITFTVRGSRGYLMGSEVSTALMRLTMVEFSYYMGFPVLQIAELLLGVLDQKVGERTFQANMERRVAMLLGEAMGLVRRVKRATTVGNNSVQVVSANRLAGADHPLEIVYFVEGPGGQRVPAVQTANLLNSLDVQRAAIVLGYRVQGILAQHKLEFQPDAMTSIQQRQKSAMSFRESGTSLRQKLPPLKRDIDFSEDEEEEEEYEEEEEEEEEEEVKRGKLQAPSVKGFDFAKLHLGQQSKDDVMVIQEPVPPGSGPGPLPVSIKDGLSPSENGEIPTPISKNSASSTKASRSGRRRERISPSDGDSMVSDRSSERESTEENLRAHATPSDSKQTRPPPMNGTNEHLSSASIFEHVDRMSRTTDASRRLPNKVQLIAMQPMPVPPLHSPPVNGKLSDTNQINKEIQVALRHKSEIEHHRNKIRLRAKRKGHYDFPAMDDVTSGLGDMKDQDRIYQKAQIQIDKILDPDSQMPSIFMESKKSGRGRRSPKQRMKEQLNGGMMDADKDHLITDDSDAAYRKCPGVNNVAYVSDPDQGPGSPHRSPSPTDDVFLGPTSSPPGHAPPPPPYMPPQPSIEEARQQMHSLLDDAFALVSPTSQNSTAGITLPGVSSNPPASSPPGRGPRPWGPSYQGLSPFPGRFTELSMSPAPVQGLTPRQGLGSSYLPPGETAGHSEQLQPDSLYSSRGLYADELPSSARPRPVGGTTGAQLHHLTQVGLSSRMNGYPAGVRPAPGQNGGIGWNHYHDDNFSRVEPEKDAFLDCPDYSSSSIFQMPRSGIREPSAPPAHIDPPVVGYLSAPPPLDTSPPTHSSASLIKAIREELLRLSQKQAALPSYHS